MKLLVIFPSANRGGAENYALTIASAAVKRGWDVQAAFPKTPKTASLIQDFQENGISYHPLDIAPVGGHRFKFFREHLPQFFKTLVLLSKLKPDVIQLNIPWGYAGFDSILACGMLKIPTVIVFHLFPRRFFYSNARIKAYAWARSRNQKWIAISENNRKFICESFYLSPSEVSLIYNGTKIDSPWTNLSEDKINQLRQQIRQELGIPANSKILLTVARLARVKGYAELIEVVYPIIQEFPEVIFIWIGEGEMREYLEQKIQQYSIEGRVIILGYRADVPRFLKSADLFIFPTHLEGLPFAIIETMAHNLPIVASDASSIPEIIENKVHGVLFPSGHKQALLESIRWALMHPEAMQEMAVRAQIRAGEFSEAKMIEQTLNLIENMSISRL
jgi:glycosyltransferase involved in cell wall biosynthesis